MVLIIDNYDSFTYNLAQYVGELKREFKVIRNDEISIDEVWRLNPTHIIISPGPGRPEDAGISCDLILEFSGKIPLLGVCLGHQCIAHVFRGTVGPADRLMHGKISKIYHNGEGIFQGVPSPFEATRYHSLMAIEESLPENIHITAHTSDGEIMGLKLNDAPVEGVQFHPESIMTQHGHQLLGNFLNLR
ncbi:MAG: aminodeoxychorismate/anthranilate synthase component II [Candidatus Zixiibacteriota bacterium]